MIISYFINGRETDRGTWRLARKLCKKDSIPHRVMTFVGTNKRYWLWYLIQRHLNCDEEMLLRSHLKKKRYVFDYYTDEQDEHFCLDDRLTGKQYEFKSLNSLVQFARDNKIRIKQIQNDDSLGIAWHDFLKAYKGGK